MKLPEICSGAMGLVVAEPGVVVSRWSWSWSCICLYLYADGDTAGGQPD